MTQRFSRARLLAYGLPGLPLAVLGLPLYVLLPPYYADLGVPLSLVGSVLLLARLFDVLSDPAIGILSDRLHTPFGRRKPWIALGTPLLMAGGWALLVPGETASATWLLSFSVLTYLGWTLILLPYSALGAELSDAYHERSRITAAREGAVIAGTLLAVGLPGVLAWQGRDSGVQLQALAWLLILSLPVAVGILLAGVREPAVRSGPARPPRRWREGLRLLAGNRPFVRLLAAYLLNGMANGLPATLVVLFVKHVLQLPDKLGLFLGVYFLAGVLALPAWLALSRRLGKHRTWAVSMLWACAVFVWVPALGADDFYPFLLICALSGVSLGVDVALPASMQADVIDLDTARGGGGRAGLYFGLWGMATKLALALAVGVAYPLLDAAGFDPKAATPEGLRALAWLYAALPVLLKFISVALVWRFPLDAERHAALRSRLVPQG